MCCSLFAIILRLFLRGRFLIVQPCHLRFARRKREGTVCRVRASSSVMTASLSVIVDASSDGAGAGGVAAGDLRCDEFC